jgi:hypothetical protein
MWSIINGKETLALLLQVVYLPYMILLDGSQKSSSPLMGNHALDESYYRYELIQTTLKKRKNKLHSLYDFSHTDDSLHGHMSVL